MQLTARSRFAWEWFLILFGAGCAGGGARPLTPISPAPPAPLAARLQARLAASQSGASSRAVAGLVAGGRLVWWQGRAPRADQTPGLDTPFRIGSLTKLLTALLVLDLRDQGRLQLDSPIDRDLPEARGIRLPTADSAPITLRALLTHTSGLPRSCPENGNDAAPVSLDGVRLRFAPGTDVAYSNLGYVLVGRIAARAGGAPYQSLLAERILRPLGMTATHFPAAGEGPPAGRPWTMLGDADAAGGLVSTGTDIARLIQLELAAWPARDDPERDPLPRRLVRESQLALGGQRSDRRSFGAGWILTQLGSDRLVTLTGKIDGTSATIALLPDRGLGAFVLDEQASASSEPLAFALLEEATIDAGRSLDATSAAFADALDTVLRLLAGTPRAALADRFAPGFFEQVRGFDAVIAQIRSRYGACAQVRSTRLTSAVAGDAIVACAAGELHVSLELTPEAPGRIGLLMLR